MRLLFITKRRTSVFGAAGGMPSGKQRVVVLAVYLVSRDVPDQSYIANTSFCFYFLVSHWFALS
jgi:hypothetical protein